MSLIITLHGEEGIVMASDSRITINNTTLINGVSTVNIGISQSDSIYKIFQAAEHIGISYCGESTLAGIPLAGYVEGFIRKKIEEEKIGLDEVPASLVTYFKGLQNVPDTVFHVAGYTLTEGVAIQKIWRVILKSELIHEIVPKTQLRGAIWNGEMDILSRIIQNNIFFKEPNGIYSPLPSFVIPFDIFTLQDMIDFAVYAICTTSDSMRFQMRPKTVGGPVDVLVIKPSGSSWIQKKILEVK
jgi:hypothetical protein